MTALFCGNKRHIRNELFSTSFVENRGSFNKIHQRWPMKRFEYFFYKSCQYSIYVTYIASFFVFNAVLIHQI